MGRFVGVGILNYFFVESSGIVFFMIGEPLA